MRKLLRTFSAIALAGSLAASMAVTAHASTTHEPSVSTEKISDYDETHSDPIIQKAIDKHIRSIQTGRAEIGTDNQQSDEETEPNTNPEISLRWKFAGYEVDVTSVQHGTVMPKILDSCGVTGKQTKCSINRTVTASSSLEAGGGLNIKAFNASTSYTIQNSITTSLSSTSPKMHSRQMYVARPQGTFYIFKWRKYTAGIKTSSGSGTAFSPTGVQFRVIAI